MKVYENVQNCKEMYKNLQKFTEMQEMKIYYQKCTKIIKKKTEMCRNVQKCMKMLINV